MGPLVQNLCMKFLLDVDHLYQGPFQCARSVLGSLYQVLITCISLVKIFSWNVICKEHSLGINHIYNFLSPTSRKSRTQKTEAIFIPADD